MTSADSGHKVLDLLRVGFITHVLIRPLDYTVCTLLIAEILSGKNVRTWVSMDFT